MLTDDDRRLLTDAADTLDDADAAIRDATALGCDPKAMAAGIRAIVDRPAPTPTPAPGLDLDAVERAERAMTAGPWRMHGYAAEIVDADDETVARLDMRGDRITGGDARGFSDAAGIVALRNSAPALIAEVRALRARLAEAKRLGLEFVALHREAGNCDGWGPFPEMRSKRMAAIAAALGAL